MMIILFTLPSPQQLILNCIHQADDGLVFGHVFNFLGMSPDCATSERMGSIS
jgi:hypothetical protein